MRITYLITYNNRAINFKATVTFAAMGKYVTDFMSYFRHKQGFVVTKITGPEVDNQE